ncbi:MAG TPA: ribonuclease P protein component [Candidatus Moranbacteria bacterium]|nr:ribonuclease P protein component [Candidatus Moranbacteria bacterium]
MLAREHRLTERSDFERVYAQGAFFGAPDVALKVLRTPTRNLRIGFSVGKQFSPQAVARNRMRRVLRAIMGENISRIHSGADVIVICRTRSGKIDSKSLRSQLEKLLQKARLTA